jgi:hypothetical protein
MGSPKQEMGDSKAAEQRRDEMLLRLLKTPPQPRPKRERAKSVTTNSTKRKKKTPDK